MTPEEREAGPARRRAAIGQKARRHQCRAAEACDARGIASRAPQVPPLPSAIPPPARRIGPAPSASGFLAVACAHVARLGGSESARLTRPLPGRGEMLLLRLQLLTLTVLITHSIDVDNARFFIHNC